MHSNLILLSVEFPLWLRLTHYVNLLFVGLLIRSGVEILGAHPRLYWHDGCTPNTEWLKFTKHTVPTDPAVIHTARDEEIAISPLLALPGKKNLGLGRHWHGVSNLLWLLNGVIYVVLLLTTGEWTRLIPTSWDIFPRAWHSLLIYLSLQVPPLSEFRPYDPLQQLTYAFVVFVLAPGMLLTGLAMSPAIAASAPRYIALFGGRQVARSLHFLGMAAFALFTVLHVTLVLVVHFRENIANIVLGRPGNVDLAFAIAIIALLLVLGLYIWTSWYSLRHKRRVQIALDRIEAPLRSLALHHLTSRQHYRESAISSYLWVNGAPAQPLAGGAARAARSGADHGACLRAGLVGRWQMARGERGRDPGALRTIARGAVRQVHLLWPGSVHLRRQTAPPVLRGARPAAGWRRTRRPSSPMRSTMRRCRWSTGHPCACGWRPS